MAVVLLVLPLWLGFYKTKKRNQTKNLIHFFFSAMQNSLTCCSFLPFEPRKRKKSFKWRRQERSPHRNSQCGKCRIEF